MNVTLTHHLVVPVWSILLILSFIFACVLLTLVASSALRALDGWIVRRAMKREVDAYANGVATDVPRHVDPVLGRNSNASIDGLVERY